MERGMWKQFVIHHEPFNVSVTLTSVRLLAACLPKVSPDTARAQLHTHACTYTHTQTRTHTSQPSVLCLSYTNSLQPCLQGISTRKPNPLSSRLTWQRERERERKDRSRKLFTCKGWGATLTIKSASGREVKGKEALRGGKKGFHLQGFACVGLWVGDW